MNSVAETIPVAVYARVSTEHDAQLYALENQEDWYKEQLAKHPEWNLYQMYVDKGITGTSAAKRPEFQRMICDAKQGKFKLILTRETSRFARNIVDSISYARELLKYGVGIYFINDGINTLDSDGEFRLGLFSIFAQDESRKLSERCKAGVHTSMTKGVPLGSGNILGYDKVNGEFVINPEQAKTVRMIFDKALDGKGVRTIKRELEQAGRLTAMGKSRWYESNISQILDNKFYYGLVEYHKYITPSYLEQRQQKNKGEVEKVILWGKHEPIVTEEEFNKVQKIRASHRKNNHDGRLVGVKQSNDVWTKLLVCGECGRSFGRNKWHKYKNGQTTYAYQCKNQKQNGTKKTLENKGLPTDGICSAPYVPQWRLELMSKYVFEKYIKNYDGIVDKAKEIVGETLKSDINLREEKLAEIENLKKENEKKKLSKSKLMDLLVDEVITKEDYKEKSKDIDSIIQHNALKIIELENDVASLAKAGDGDYLIDNLCRVLDKMKDFSSLDVIPPEIVESFIEKIIVYPDNVFIFVLKYNGRHIIKSAGTKSKGGEITEKFPPMVNCITGNNYQRGEINIIYSFSVSPEMLDNFVNKNYTYLPRYSKKTNTTVHLAF